MPSISSVPQGIRYALQAPAWRRFALYLLLATGCSSRSALNVQVPDSSVDLAGAAPKEGEGGRGVSADAADTKGVGASGGTTGSGASTESGGNTGRGGLSGSDGALDTGDVPGTSLDFHGGELT